MSDPSSSSGDEGVSVTPGQLRSIISDTVKSQHEEETEDMRRTLNARLERLKKIKHEAAERRTKQSRVLQVRNESRMKRELFGEEELSAGDAEEVFGILSSSASSRRSSLSSVTSLEGVRKALRVEHRPAGGSLRIALRGMRSEPVVSSDGVQSSSEQTRSNDASDAIASRAGSPQQHPTRDFAVFTSMSGSEKSLEILSGSGSGTVQAADDISDNPLPITVHSHTDFSELSSSGPAGRIPERGLALSSRMDNPALAEEVDHQNTSRKGADTASAANSRRSKNGTGVTPRQRLSSASSSSAIRRPQSLRKAKPQPSHTRAPLTTPNRVRRVPKEKKERTPRRKKARAGMPRMPEIDGVGSPSTPKRQPVLSHADSEDQITNVMAFISARSTMKSGPVTPEASVREAAKDSNRNTDDIVIPPVTVEPAMMGSSESSDGTSPPIPKGGGWGVAVKTPPGASSSEDNTAQTTILNSDDSSNEESGSTRRSTATGYPTYMDQDALRKAFERQIGRALEGESDSHAAEPLLISQSRPISDRSQVQSTLFQDSDYEESRGSKANIAAKRRSGGSVVSNTSAISLSRHLENVETSSPRVRLPSDNTGEPNSTAQQPGDLSLLSPEPQGEPAVVPYSASSSHEFFEAMNNLSNRFYSNSALESTKAEGEEVEARFNDVHFFEGQMGGRHYRKKNNEATSKMASDIQYPTDIKSHTDSATTSSARTHSTLPSDSHSSETFSRPGKLNVEALQENLSDGTNSSASMRQSYVSDLKHSEYTMTTDTESSRGHSIGKRTNKGLDVPQQPSIITALISEKEERDKRAEIQQRKLRRRKRKGKVESAARKAREHIKKRSSSKPIVKEDVDMQLRLPSSRSASRAQVAASSVTASPDLPPIPEEVHSAHPRLQSQPRVCAALSSKLLPGEMAGVLQVLKRDGWLNAHQLLSSSGQQNTGSSSSYFEKKSMSVQPHRSLGGHTSGLNAFPRPSIIDVAAQADRRNSQLNIPPPSASSRRPPRLSFSSVVSNTDTFVGPARASSGELVPSPMSRASPARRATPPPAESRSRDVWISFLGNDMSNMRSSMLYDASGGSASARNSLSAYSSNSATATSGITHVRDGSSDFDASPSPRPISDRRHSMLTPSKPIMSRGSRTRGKSISALLSSSQTGTQGWGRRFSQLLMSSGSGVQPMGLSELPHGGIDLFRGARLRASSSEGETPMMHLGEMLSGRRSANLSRASNDNRLPVPTARSGRSRYSTVEIKKEAAKNTRGRPRRHSGLIPIRMVQPGNMLARGGYRINRRSHSRSSGSQIWARLGSERTPTTAVNSSSGERTDSRFVSLPSGNRLSLRQATGAHPNTPLVGLGRASSRFGVETGSTSSSAASQRRVTALAAMHRHSSNDGDDGDLPDSRVLKWRFQSQRIPSVLYKVPTNADGGLVPIGAKTEANASPQGGNTTSSSSNDKSTSLSTVGKASSTGDKAPSGSSGNSKSSQSSNPPISVGLTSRGSRSTALLSRLRDVNVIRNTDSSLSLFIPTNQGQRDSTTSPIDPEGDLEDPSVSVGASNVPSDHEDSANATASGSEHGAVPHPSAGARLHSRLTAARLTGAIGEALGGDARALSLHFPDGLLADEFAHLLSGIGLLNRNVSHDPFDSLNRRIAEIRMEQRLQTTDGTRPDSSRSMSSAVSETPRSPKSPVSTRNTMSERNHSAPSSPLSASSVLKASYQLPVPLGRARKKHPDSTLSIATTPTSSYSSRASTPISPENYREKLYSMVQAVADPRTDASGNDALEWSAMDEADNVHRAALSDNVTMKSLPGFETAPGSPAHSHSSLLTDMSAGSERESKEDPIIPLQFSMLGDVSFGAPLEVDAEGVPMVERPGEVDMAMKSALSEVDSNVPAHSVSLPTKDTPESKKPEGRFGRPLLHRDFFPTSRKSMAYWYFYYCTKRAVERFELQSFCVGEEDGASTHSDSSRSKSYRGSRLRKKISERERKYRREKLRHNYWEKQSQVKGRPFNPDYVDTNYLPRPQASAPPPATSKSRSPDRRSRRASRSKSRGRSRSPDVSAQQRLVSAKDNYRSKRAATSPRGSLLNRTSLRMSKALQSSSSLLLQEGFGVEASDAGDHLEMSAASLSTERSSYRHRSNFGAVGGPGVAMGRRNNMVAELNATLKATVNSLSSLCPKRVDDLEHSSASSSTLMPPRPAAKSRRPSRGGLRMPVLVPDEVTIHRGGRWRETPAKVSKPKSGSGLTAATDTAAKLTSSTSEITGGSSASEVGESSLFFMGGGVHAAMRKAQSPGCETKLSTLLDALEDSLDKSSGEDADVERETRGRFASNAQSHSEGSSNTRFAVSSVAAPSCYNSSAGLMSHLRHVKKLMPLPGISRPQTFFDALGVFLVKLGADARFWQLKNVVEKAERPPSPVFFDCLDRVSSMSDRSSMFDQSSARSASSRSEDGQSNASSKATPSIQSPSPPPSGVFRAPNESSAANVMEEHPDFVELPPGLLPFPVFRGPLEKPFYPLLNCVGLAFNVKWQIIDDDSPAFNEESSSGSSMEELEALVSEDNDKFAANPPSSFSPRSTAPTGVRSPRRSFAEFTPDPKDAVDNSGSGVSADIAMISPLSPLEGPSGQRFFPDVKPDVPDAPVEMEKDVPAPSTEQKEKEKAEEGTVDKPDHRRESRSSSDRRSPRRSPERRSKRSPRVSTDFAKRRRLRDKNRSPQSNVASVTEGTRVEVNGVEVDTNVVQQTGSGVTRVEVRDAARRKKKKKKKASALRGNRISLKRNSRKLYIREQDVALAQKISENVARLVPNKSIVLAVAPLDANQAAPMEISSSDISPVPEPPSRNQVRRYKKRSKSRSNAPIPATVYVISVSTPAEQAAQAKLQQAVQDTETAVAVSRTISQIGARGRQNLFGSQPVVLGDKNTEIEQLARATRTAAKMQIMREGGNARAVLARREQAERDQRAAQLGLVEDGLQPRGPGAEMALNVMTGGRGSEVLEEARIRSQVARLRRSFRKWGNYGTPVWWARADNLVVPGKRERRQQKAEDKELVRKYKDLKKLDKRRKRAKYGITGDVDPSKFSRRR